MNNTQTQLMVALAAVVLLASVPYVAAQGSGIEYQYATGMVSLTTDDIGVRVSAYNQVPHFHWWNASSPGTDYHVMFLKLFEADDTDDDGAFDPETDRIVGVPYLLPASIWDFSGFVTEEQDSVVVAVHFNFTTTDTFTPTVPITTTPTIPAQVPDPFDVTLQIRVHIDVNNPQEMKFDIVISGWSWTYDDSILVFQFTVTESEHGADEGTDEPPEFVQDGNRFEFGEGYLEYAEQAQAGESVVQVRGVQGQGTGDEAGKSVYLAFAYFGDETLEYDPIIGISPAAEDGNGLDIDYNQLLLMAGGVSIIVLVIIIAKMKR
jgi:hypothetical protein